MTRSDYECRDPALLEAALTHRSAGGPHNERLEFLGDAVLNCVVARLIFQRVRGADEGDLSRFRASLVSGEALAVIAAEIHLGDQLRLGSGELKSGGFRRKSILADALEALFGAIYLDGGFEAAARVIERLFVPRLDRPAERGGAERSQDALAGAAAGPGLPLPVVSQSNPSPARRTTSPSRCAVRWRCLPSKPSARAPAGAAPSRRPRPQLLQITGGEPVRCDRVSSIGVVTAC